MHYIHCAVCLLCHYYSHSFFIAVIVLGDTLHCYYLLGLRWVFYNSDTFCGIYCLFDLCLLCLLFSGYITVPFILWVCLICLYYLYITCEYYLLWYLLHC